MVTCTLDGRRVSRSVDPDARAVRLPTQPQHDDQARLVRAHGVQWAVCRVPVCAWVRPCGVWRVWRVWRVRCAVCRVLCNVCPCVVRLPTQPQHGDQAQLVRAHMCVCVCVYME